MFKKLRCKLGMKFLGLDKFDLSIIHVSLLDMEMKYTKPKSKNILKETARKDMLNSAHSTNKRILDISIILDKSLEVVRRLFNSSNK